MGHPEWVEVLSNSAQRRSGCITVTWAISPAFAVFFVLRSINVIRARRQHKAGIGTGRNKWVDWAMRVHASFAEYVPRLSAAGHARCSWWGGWSEVARASLWGYIGFYNTRRLHSSLDGKTLDQACFNPLAPVAAAAYPGGKTLKKSQSAVLTNSATTDRTSSSPMARRSSGGSSVQRMSRRRILPQKSVVGARFQKESDQRASPLI